MISSSCSRWFLARLIFDPEDGDDTFFRNVGLYTGYTALYPRGCQISKLPLWEPQILRTVICLLSIHNFRLWRWSQSAFLLKRRHGITSQTIVRRVCLYTSYRVRAMENVCACIVSERLCVKTEGRLLTSWKLLWTKLRRRRYRVLAKLSSVGRHPLRFQCWADRWLVRTVMYEPYACWPVRPSVCWTRSYYYSIQRSPVRTLARC
jgi:hypothetical protein